MIIVLKPDAGQDAAREILEVIRKAGLKPLYMPGVERTVESREQMESLAAIAHAVGRTL